MRIQPYAGKLRLIGADTSKLDNIPGLRVFEDGNAIGHSDALDVALARHGEGPLASQHWTPSWNHGYTPNYLRDYQTRGVSWLATHLKHEGGALLGDDMGLGKTVQTISVWGALAYPCILIVCPASVRRTWLREFEKWAPEAKVCVVTEAKRATLCLDHAVTITSYELVAKLPQTYEPDMLVLDEAQLLRGRGAKRSRTLLDFAKGCRYRLALTGTPMWSRPRDLWMLLRILFPNYRFGTAEQFDVAYCGAYINQWGGRVNVGATRTDELKQRLRHVMLRRTKEEVAKELPALQRTFRWVQTTPQAQRLLEAFMLKKVRMLDALSATLEAKMDEAIRTAHEAKRFLLFTWQKAHAKELWERLNKEGTPCELITGDFTHKERDAAVQRAAQNKVGVVATIDSCHAGVDGLQKVASIGIFHALDYVPIKLAQAEARLHRIGQTLPVQWVYVCMENSADALVADTIISKLDQWRSVMGRDSTANMRDAVMDTKENANAEKEALAALYAADARDKHNPDEEGD